jgi:hypothetical protein|uniref:Uncharacterized protein n=1 Tax=Siphoviridae sp. ctqpo8 TaxID=2826469 RepID=A0A8S5M2M2_9CAUD|nr:MAG TPA: hypothetical protein [Siphoviridae sp. ctqpo8]
MKSEKAKAIIRENDFYFSIDGVTFQEARAMMKKDAIKAVELAEQEAEERMREKAVKIFTEILYMPARQLAKECGVSVDDVEEDSGIDYCRILFIQKLTE